MTVGASGFSWRGFDYSAFDPSVFSFFSWICSSRFPFSVSFGPIAFANLRKVIALGPVDPAIRWGALWSVSRVPLSVCGFLL